MLICYPIDLSALALHKWIVVYIYPHPQSRWDQCIIFPPFESGTSAKDVYQECFIKLVNSRFVERCPTPEPLISSPNEDAAPAKKGGGRSKVIS